MAEEPEQDDVEIEEDEPVAEDQAEGGELLPKGERRPRNFRANAVQNLMRARKSISAPDAEVPPRAQLLVSSAVAWALLDLAEAVRTRGLGPEDDAGE